MSASAKLGSSHLRRQAFVYVRQSTQAQTERNTESTERQYALVVRALELGFAREQVEVIDDDLGVSGSGEAERSGFARLAAEVALGHAGLVLGLEVSRLARNSADWYRLPRNWLPPIAQSASQYRRRSAGRLARPCLCSSDAPTIRWGHKKGEMRFDRGDRCPRLCFAVCEELSAGCSAVI
jgi:Resolvase, N terminal domain